MAVITQNDHYEAEEKCLYFVGNAVSTFVFTMFF